MAAHGPCSGGEQAFTPPVLPFERLIASGGEAGEGSSASQLSLSSSEDIRSAESIVKRESLSVFLSGQAFCGVGFSNGGRAWPALR
jgi:hypothetical protein